MNEGWKVERRYSQFNSREVFISPDGVEHERCAAEAATVVLPSKTRGLQPMYLRPTNWRLANLRRPS